MVILKFHEKPCPGKVNKMTSEILLKYTCLVFGKLLCIFFKIIDR